MKQTAAKGTTSKHAGTGKHTTGKGKHHPAAAKKAATHHHAAKGAKVHTAAKGHTAAKPRKLARGGVQRDLLRLWPASGGEAEPRQPPGASSWAVLDDVACCTVLALAASLRLSGRACGADDVLALYGLLTRDADAGVPIVAALEAAAEFGLAGVRPAWFAQQARPGLPASGGADCRHHPAVARELGLPFFTRSPHPGFQINTGLILGLELPGPHAVTVAPDGCWLSWGGHYDPACWPDAVIEEAWAVTWP